MLRLLALALVLSSAAQAQPFSTVTPLGPLTVESGGETLPLQPLAAAADGDGFVVIAMVTRYAPEDATRRQPWALRLDADGALVQQQSLGARLGRIDVSINPRLAPTMHVDGDGWLVGGVFEDSDPDGARDVLRAVRIAPDLSATVVAERALGPQDPVRVNDVIRLGDDLVLFAGDIIVNGGYQNIPLALVVSAAGGEKALVPPDSLSESVTSAAALGSHVVLAGWTTEGTAEGGAGRQLVVRTFDESLTQVAAQRLSIDGFSYGARLAALDGDRVFLAAALPDSVGIAHERIWAAIVGVPGIDILGSTFAAERSADRYTVDGVVSIVGVGTGVIGRAPAGAAATRAVIVRHPEGDDAGWTVLVGSPTSKGLALAVGQRAGADGPEPTALSAVADAAGVWSLELARLTAARPASDLFAPFEDAVVADEAAFDAYGAALDVSADSAAVSHELQRQATALLDADFARGADAILAPSVRLQMRVRPGLPLERQRCLASLYLWTLARERALASDGSIPVPERPVTDCER